MTHDETFGHGVGDDTSQQSNRTNCVVVTRDRVRELVGVGVGVEDAHDRDAKLLRFLDGKVLALGVNNPQRTRGLGEVADSTERRVEFDELTALHEKLLLGEAL